MQQSLYLCMFLSLCHSSDSSADAYDLFRVLDNQQKKNKILPADTDVKQRGIMDLTVINFNFEYFSESEETISLSIST